MVQRNRLDAARARTDTRDWAKARRERTRHLIELGGLVAKADLVELLEDDRATLLGALLDLAGQLRGMGDHDPANLCARWRRHGLRVFAAEREAADARQGQEGKRNGRGRSTVSGEIYLVRHGETVWNAEGRFQGQLDSPLTHRGREQATQNGMLLARTLAGRTDFAMQTSPLGRTQETTSLIRAHLACTNPTFEPRIQEVTVGCWDGLTHTDIDAGWPGLLDGSTAFNWYFRAPDGEVYDAAVERVRSWLHEVDGSIVAVSHGLIGRLIRGAYLGLSRDDALTLPVPQDVVWLLAQGRVEALAG